MDLNVAQLISQYGYWAMLIGALIEGETFLIAGGIAAKHGLLSVPLLILIAWLGSMLHDVTCFLLGRYAGSWIIGKFPRIEHKIQKSQSMIKHHSNKIVLAERFIYGFRIFIPLALGSTRSISAKRFVLLNAIGGLVWATLFVMLGYLFGQVLDVVLSHLAHYSVHEIWWLLGAVLIVAAMILTIVGWRRYRD